jgi:hypothetical protein
MPARRLAVLAAALTLSALAGPASADHYAPTCPDPGSTKLVTAETPRLRLWVHTASATETRVCYEAATVSSGVVVLRGSLGVPVVNVTPGTGACQTTLLSVTDPVAVKVSVGAPAVQAVCIGLNGVTYTVSFSTASGPLPRVELWRTGGLVDELVFCAPELAAYLAKPEVNYDAYAECAYHPHRVV